MQQPAGQEAQEWRNERQQRNKKRWQGTRRHEERRCNNQPDKKGESGRTRGNGAARSGGRWDVAA
jgi:hypothetical protein